ncbi:MAG TPA: glycosyltransferase family 4 protein, partial [Gaiellaceae bacterium]|nr:glycosyltransferase family 4 protein [Gaiellaceae bacterium]
GRFVADAVERVRARGIEVEVVSPLTFRHFGIAYGSGVVGNLRRAPWKALLLPLVLAAFARAAHRATREADVVHAHWLPAGVVALATRKPIVLQPWGTDVELARRVPRIARAVLRRAAVVVCASDALADAVRELGARRVQVVPTGVDLPEEIGDEADPPEVLFAGRLSREKGILELVEACRGLELVVAGDGPLRDRVPGARGWVDRAELQRLYARAAVVACPSHREGYGMAAREAMAHGRPVVASAVGGLAEAVADGETGLLVPPGDVPALRAALLRLLEDDQLRARMGAAARAWARDRLSWVRATDLLLDAYAEAAGRTATAQSESPNGSSTVSSTRNSGTSRS